MSAGCRITKPGDPIRIGDTLGHGMESNLIVGRVTGFIKGKVTRVIFRTYLDQTEVWPSGPYRTTALPSPHRHFRDGKCERYIHPDERIDGGDE